MARSIVPVAVMLGLLLAGFGTAAAQEATPGASPAAGCPTTSEAENEAIARRWHEDAINGGDLGVLDEILAEDVVHDAATFEEDRGREASRRVLGALVGGFPDVRHTVDDVLTEGDLVALRWTATGTHEGEFQGIEPTGRQATWTGINVYRMECGRIAAVWSEADGLGRLQQLGVLSLAEDLPAGTPGPASPVGATPAAGCPTAGEAEHEALARRWWDEAWSGGNLDALDEVLAADHVHHWAVGPDTTGPAPVKGRLATWRAAFPDLRVTVEDAIAEGDRVVARWVATGTHEGAFQGQAPTGRSVEWRGINIFRIECGRIAEAWSEMDTLGLRAQLGLPAGAGTPLATPSA